LLCKGAEKLEKTPKLTEVKNILEPYTDVAATKLSSPKLIPETPTKETH
jgi:hypothetical protein